MVVVVGVMDSVFTYHLYHIGGTCVCMYCFWCVIPNGDLSLCSTLVPRVLLVSPIGNVVFAWLYCICEESFHNSSSIHWVVVSSI